MTGQRSIRDLASEDRGAILVLVAVSLAMFLAMTAWAFDTGRLSVTNSDLQSYADSVALAAAGELDGNSDAITRATSAAATLISDTQTFGEGDRTLLGPTDYTLTFLSDLPGDDTAAATAVTTDPAEAVFVRVDVTPVTVDQGFARAFRTLLGLAHADPRTSASATAGFTQMACDITPMMFCIPPAAAGEDVWTADNHVGEMIHLRAKGGSGSWQPGNFGFLDIEGGIQDEDGTCAGQTGAGLYRCLIGATRNISRCVATRGVDFNPGQSNGLNRGLNTRFDIYPNPQNTWTPAEQFAPAPNVIKGVREGGTGSANACTNHVAANNAGDTVPLPRDTCILNGTCGRFGNGSWDRDSYLSVNHRDPAGSWTDPVVSLSASYDGVMPGSRYELYLAEIEAIYGTPYPAPGPVSATPLTSGTLETGAPICSPSGVHAGSERRLMVVAGIDCNPPNSYPGNASGVPVAEYSLVFLTEPMGDGPDFDLFVEVVGSVDEDGAGTGGTGGIFRDLVQLYR